MEFLTIDALIDRSGIQPGDSVWMKERLLGLIDNYIIYLGRDDMNLPLFVGRLEHGIISLSPQQIDYLIKSTRSARVNKLVASDSQRQQVTDRMRNRQDMATFHLIMRNSQDFKQEVAVKQKDFEWKYIARGAGIAAAVLGAVGIGLAAWKLWYDNKDK